MLLIPAYAAAGCKHLPGHYSVIETHNNNEPSHGGTADIKATPEKGTFNLYLNMTGKTNPYPLTLLCSHNPGSETYEISIKNMHGHTLTAQTKNTDNFSPFWQDSFGHYEYLHFTRQ